MSNVVPMERTCDYWIARAVRHRLAGRYDEAMALLSKAKEQFGPSAELELELAKTYDETGCEEDAARAYLRVVRLGGKGSAQALFQLALTSLTHGDLRRAQSYMDRFAATDQSGVSGEMAELLGRQLRGEIECPAPQGRRGRARALERRAMERMQAGKLSAAVRAMEHAIRLRPSAQRYTLLACCALMQGNAEAAVVHARRAHSLSPGRVQTLCVLADAYCALGKTEPAKLALRLAALRAEDAEDLLCTAMESAKHGEDRLTLRVTRRLLAREPLSTRGMMLRACALLNLGRISQARQLLGRLCGLKPEDTVCEYLYRNVDALPPERLTLGMDVPLQEATARASRILGALCEGETRSEDEERALCRLCAWAMRSELAARQMGPAAALLLSEIDTTAAREALLDALTDPQAAEPIKMIILQLLTAKAGMLPFDVDIGGGLTRLAAGGTANRGDIGSAGQRTIQRAADVLIPRYPDAPGVLLPLWIAYLETYGAPQGRRADACAAALECVYHELAGRRVSRRRIAVRCGVSARLCALCIRRIYSASDRRKTMQEDETHELH